MTRTTGWQNKNNSNSITCMRCNLFMEYSSVSYQILCNHCYLGMVRFVENYDNTDHDQNNNITECPERYFNQNHNCVATHNDNYVSRNSCFNNLNNIRNAVIATQEHMNFRSM